MFWSGTVEKPLGRWITESKAENAERQRDREQETETETGDRNTGAVGRHQARRALQTMLEC